MTGGGPIVKIANELFEYSNMFVEIRCDRAMPIPGFSLIEEDIHGLLKPVTVLNPELLQEDPSVIAHVMAHEWGHHVLQHISKTPACLGSDPALGSTAVERMGSRQAKENEADTYAARFIKSHKYDSDAIMAFMREHPFDLENRLQILMETMPTDEETRFDSQNSSVDS